jgi:hypothetical protein
MEAFVNEENNEKIPKGLLGTQMPSLPRPLLLLGDARTLLRKAETVSKKVVPS